MPPWSSCQKAELARRIYKKLPAAASRIDSPGKDAATAAPPSHPDTGFENGGGNVLSKGHGERASVGEEHDQGISSAATDSEDIVERGRLRVQAIGLRKNRIAGNRFSYQSKMREGAVLTTATHDIRFCVRRSRGT